MIEKSECLPGNLAIVNSKISKYNVDLCAKNNGLSAFQQGVFISGIQDLFQQFEIPVGTKIKILSKPKRIDGSSVTVLFKVENDDTVWSSWWIVFKHKVDYKI